MGIIRLAGELTQVSDILGGVSGAGESTLAVF